MLSHFQVKNLCLPKPLYLLMCWKAKYIVLFFLWNINVYICIPAEKSKL